MSARSMKMAWSALLVLLAACGASTPLAAPLPDEVAASDETPATTSWNDGLAIVPDGLPLVARFDVARFRSSPYYDRIVPLVEHVVPPEARRQWRTTLDHSREIVGGVRFDRAGEPTGGVVAVVGAVDEGALYESVRAVASDVHVHVGERVAYGQLVLDMDQVSFFESGGAAWVIGDRGTFGMALAVAHGEAPSLRSGQRHRAIADRIQFERATLTGIVELPDAARQQMKRDDDELFRIVADSVLRAAGSLDLVDGLDAHVDVEATSSEGATRLAEGLRARLAELSAEPELATLGISGYVGRVQVDVDGSHVVLGLQLSRAETDVLLGIAGTFMQGL